MGIEPNIDSLLKPYKNVGTSGHKIELTLELISFELVNRFQYSPETAGAAIWGTFHEMVHKGLKFGDGRELVLYIKNKAAEIRAKETKELIKNQLITDTTCMKLNCPFRSGELKILSRWNRFVLFMCKPRGFWRL